MPDTFTDEQRQFLQLLRLPVPGEAPPEMAPAKPSAKAVSAVPNRSVSAQTTSVSASMRPAETPVMPPESLPRPVEEGVSVLRNAVPATATLSTAVAPTPVRSTSPLSKAEALQAPVLATQASPSSADPQRITRIATLDWRDLNSMVSTCQACPLGETRKHAVFGAGNPRGSWLFVGEAPGAEEDRRGEAFVGRAGQLLDNMLRAMGLSREKDVYIANILKCRPPNNRDPLGPEVQACMPYLQRQIDLLQTRVIVALGRFAAQGLLQVDTPLSQLRGTTQHYQGIPLIVTYHPAYLLRNPIDKRKVWEDLKRALGVFAELQK
ncbi:MULTISPECIES: uracil-DNA glycosylase [Acidithiobacillus]|uniref:Type-4 uracil-DNA glycosylase n=2 Tax=Acidithiobacillus TaxID=119977 RepID=A0A179B6N0_ACIFR|nr:MULTISPECIES: uracil-DNA glycosylase [Acidithiobacillus]MDA8181389.1 uracil-DNA glycosylase [Acidithiobacillus sp.]MBU2852606.1 uracil-DNA glycosylase [Acidithiobacillus ferriphilus]MEB8487478.1 uracil-DNA glycosylase [Acidithiobacillus ferriphilus]MEB8488989.1 uracil-DNA glycosylase [Acidithiobacillus ferriphilus]MEB8491899.1 uracil-DNA glycosylase [Acidithiobacillus ferriphilus]